MGTRVDIRLRHVRLSFPHLFIPRAATEGGAEKYSAAFWLDPTRVPLDKEQLAQITDGIKEITKADFKGKKPGRIAMLKGEDKYEDDPNYDGIVIVNAYNWNKPVVVDHRREPVEDEGGGQSSILYPGCYVNAALTMYSYRQAGGGIAFGLEGVQWADNGERLDSRKSAESMFEQEEGPDFMGDEDPAEDEAEDDDYEW